jgi:hypothetical protein
MDVVAERNTTPDAMMSAYKIVHAMGKTQLGGVRGDCLRDLYQRESVSEFIIIIYQYIYYLLLLKRMEYQVVEMFNLVDFQDAVNEEIRKGWTLQGGVAANSYTGSYIQAMIRNTRNKYTYDNVNSFRASPNPDSELKPVIASSGVAGGGGGGGGGVAGGDGGVAGGCGGGAILKPVIASSGVAGGGGGVKALSDPNPGKDSSKPRWFEGINIKGIAEKPVDLTALTRLTAAPARAAPARDSISDDDDIKSVYSESDEQWGGGSNKRKQKTKRSRMIKKRRTLRK